MYVTSKEVLVGAINELLAGFLMLTVSLIIVDSKQKPKGLESERSHWQGEIKLMKIKIKN